MTCRSDRRKPERWVRIRAAPGGTGGIWLGPVEDNGLGIPGPAERRVFERFFRAHPEIENGTGLPIAREAMEEMGAALWVESEEGVGSTFFAAVPARVPDDEGTAARIGVSGNGVEASTGEGVDHERAK